MPMLAADGELWSNCHVPVALAFRRRRSSAAQRLYASRRAVGPIALARSKRLRFSRDVHLLRSYQRHDPVIDGVRDVSTRIPYYRKLFAGTGDAGAHCQPGRAHDEGPELFGAPVSGLPTPQGYRDRSALAAAR